MFVAIIMLIVVSLVIALAFSWQNRTLAAQNRAPAEHAAAEPPAAVTLHESQAMIIPPELGPRPLVTGTTRVVLQRPALPPDAPPADLDAIAELLSTALAVIEALPERLDDRASLRAGALAAEYRLDELRTNLASGGLLAATIGLEAGQLANRLQRLIDEAGAITADEALLDQLEARLDREAPLLSPMLADLADQLLLPIDWGPTAATSEAALALAAAPAEAASRSSHERIKRRLALVRGLLSDLERGRQVAAAVRADREALIELLATSELAEQPAWHRVISQLAARTTGPSAERETSAALNRRAEDLLKRRAALFAGCSPCPHGGYRLAEDQVGPILEQARRLHSEIQALWQEARSLIIRHRPPTGALPVGERG